MTTHGHICLVTKWKGLFINSLHTIKCKKLKVVVLQLDISKAYDMVSWLYLRLILIQVGFQLALVNWIMSCIQSVSFVVLVNGSASVFFKTWERP